MTDDRWKLPPESLRRLLELRRSSASSKHVNKKKYKRHTKHKDRDTD